MLFIVLLLMLFFIVVSLVVCDIKKPKNFPPGPVWLPVLGSLWWLVLERRKLGYFHSAWMSLCAQWGPVAGLRLGGERVVLASSAAAVREVLTRDEFDGRQQGFFFRMRTFGQHLGLVFVDGPLWIRQRRFTLHHLRHLGLGRREMDDQVEEEVRQLIRSLQERCVADDNCIIDLHGLFDVTVLNVLWALVAGERFALTDHRLRELMDIIHEQFRATDTSGGLLNQLPWLRWLAPGWSGYSRHAATLQRMLAFLRATLQQHRDALCVDSAPRDLIDAFLQEMARGGDETFTEQQLLALCMDLFMAGSETTANTLEFVVVYLVRYPGVQARLQAELDTEVGRDRWVALRDKGKLPYTAAVLSEVQRCAHVTPAGIAHRATRDATLLGHAVPRDTLLITNLYALHTDPEVFPEPDEFRPERFLELDQATQDKYFAPFGYGKRRCLGEALARANLFLMTTALFQHFTVAAVPGAPPSLQPLDGITLSPRPCQVKLIPRD